MLDANNILYWQIALVYLFIFLAFPAFPPFRGDWFKSSEDKYASYFCLWFGMSCVGAVCWPITTAMLFAAAVLYLMFKSNIWEKITKAFTYILRKIYG